MCDMTHCDVWHDSLRCVTWLIAMCDMTHCDVWRIMFFCHDSIHDVWPWLTDVWPWLIDVWSWLIDVWPWFIDVWPWLIEMCEISSSVMTQFMMCGHDSQMCGHDSQMCGHDSLRCVKSRLLSWLNLWCVAMTHWNAWPWRIERCVAMTHSAQWVMATHLHESWPHISMSHGHTWLDMHRSCGQWRRRRCPRSDCMSWQNIGLFL